MGQKGGQERNNGNLSETKEIERKKKKNKPVKRETLEKKEIKL